MLQALLIERFRLTIRHDTKDENVYVLTVGKGGAKLKPTEIKIDEKQPTALGTDGKPRQMMMFRFQPGGAVLTAPSATVSALTELMSRFTERPVVDMTGIAGQYDWALTFSPETTQGLPTGDVPWSTTQIQRLPSSTPFKNTV